MDVSEDPSHYDFKLRSLRYYFSIAEFLGILSLILVLFWVWNFSGFGWTTPGGLISFHITFMILFLLAQTNAGLLFRLLPAMPKKIMKISHGSLHFLSIIFMTIGFVAVFLEHYVLGLPHFNSLHSWIGIITISLCYIQYTVGVGVFFYPGTTIETKKTYLQYHKFGGTAIFLCTIGAALSGSSNLAYEYKNLPTDLPSLVFKIVGLILLIFSILICYLLWNYDFRRRVRPGTLLFSQQGIFYGSTYNSRQSPVPPKSSKYVY